MFSIRLCNYPVHRGALVYRVSELHKMMLPFSTRALSREETSLSCVLRVRIAAQGVKALMNLPAPPDAINLASALN